MTLLHDSPALSLALNRALADQLRDTRAPAAGDPTAADDGRAGRPSIGDRVARSSSSRAWRRHSRS